MQCNYTLVRMEAQKWAFDFNKEISVQAQQNIQLDWICLSPDNPTLVFFFFCVKFVGGPVLDFKL